jgi:hypothetical protein
MLKYFRNAGCAGKIGVLRHIDVLTFSRFDVLALNLLKPTVLAAFMKASLDLNNGTLCD